ncbi:metallophosphoesterase [Pseudomonas mandelii]|uniref:metallophosphoesterase n=1 Tax=Pseudomonas mandelii TaxID=75612 RepID=UPI00209E2066|nr:metallophosphoesterase [Pseudomonas mandelii]MCO8309946.1 metallophosphoesterase [Pseudomonas mandelii]
MRILHISDLHITNSADHARTIAALCEDITAENKKKKIDAILCTGDIANRGDTSKTAIQAQETVIRKILNAANSAVEFLCCPGNHDINLKAREEIYESIFSNVKNSEDANKLVDNLLNKGNNAIWGHLDGYIELSKKIDSSTYQENILFTTKAFKIDPIKIGVASLNSTWRTSGGGSKDRNNLYVGERQIELALEGIRDCDIKIALMHHTLDWLAPDEKNRIQRVLATNFDALLCGHNHDNNAGHTTSTLGNLFISNTGCIYESRDHYNGYSIIDICNENNTWRIEAREYYSQRNVFDISPRFAENGVFEFNISKNNGVSKTSISSTAINAALEKANSKLLSFSASDIAPKHLSSIFVEPPLAKKSEKNLSASESLDTNGTDDFVSLHSLSQEKIDIMFIGKRESGKSTLLNHIAVNRFMEFHGNARIGLLIDITVLPKLTIAAILTQAIEFIGNEITKRDLISLLENGEALVIFDSFNIHNAAHRKIIEEFRDKYPAPRYILATNEEVQDDLSLEKLPSLSKNPTPIYIHSFKRKQTKELVRKWFGEHDQNSEEKFALVKKLLSKLNVPQTPFLVSILLWVIEQQPSAKLINQASAIEALIFGLLEKFTESKSRSNYDSNIQSHFLSELSTAMDEVSVEWINSNEFEIFVSSYFKKRGLADPSRGFTEELLRKGLLYESNQKITFKFDCFRAFFLANKLADSKEALAKVLTPISIAKYTTELDLLTGLHRDRKDILIMAKECCHQLLISSEFEIDISLFETHGKELGVFNQEETLTKIEDDFLNIPVNDNDRTKFIEETEVPSKASIDHDHARQRHPAAPLSTNMHFIGALKAYSNILRNSELIDDIELKRSCLNDVLTLWSKIIVSTTNYLHETDPKEFPDELPAQFGSLTPGQFKNFIKLMIPQLISSLMAESLATPKLETFILTETKNSSQCISFLSTMLTIENLNKHSIQAIRKLLKESGSNNIVTQAIFIRLLSLYYFEAPTSSLDAIRDCIGDAFNVLRGSSNNERSMLKGKFLQHIDEKRATNLEEHDIT